MAEKGIIEPSSGGVVDEPSESQDGDGDGGQPPDKSAPPVAAVLAFLDLQRKLAEEGANQNLKQVERSRKRTDLWGKGVLGLGTALLTALGIGKLADFLPQDGAVNQILATLGLVVALGAVMIVGLRLSRVSLPIVLRPNEDTMKKRRWRNPDGLGRRELKVVGQVYGRFATQNGIPSLAQYAAIATVIESTFTVLADDGQSPADVDPGDVEQKARTITAELDTRLRNEASGDDVARVVPTEKAISTYVEYALKHPDLARAKAALVRSELRWVMTSALADIVGRRAVNATTDWISLVILALVPIGVVASVAITYFGNATYVNRLQDWQDSKTCVEVAKSLKEGGLRMTPPECVFPAPTRPH
jgi:hypothetical protein